MFKRILKTLFALSIGQVIVRLSSFILIPLFVNYWSTTIYGEWLALSAAIGYLASLDLGISQASTNKMIQSYSNENIDKFKITQHSSLVMFTSVASLFTIVISIVIWFVPLNKWLGIVEIPEFQSKLTFLLLSLYILWSLPTKIINSTYHSLGKLAKLQWIDNTQKILYLIIVSSLLILKQNVVAIASAQLFLSMGTVAFVLFDLYKNYKMVMPGFKFARIAEVKALVVPGFFFVLYLIANLFWMQGSIILISSIFGGLLVTIFSISRTLSLFGRQVVDSFYYSLFPDLASLFAKKEYIKLRQIHKLNILISFSISFAFAITFWFYGADLIYVWTVGKVTANVALLHLLLVYVTIQTPFIASASILLATNNHKKFTVLYLTANFLGLVSSFLFVKKYGIEIIPVCFMTFEIIFCYFFVIKDACLKIEENVFGLLFSIIKYIVPLVSLLFVISYLANLLIVKLNIIPKLISGISISFILSLIVIWFIFPSKEKKFLMQKVKELKV